MLYVADTANHAIRRVDLLKGMVSSVAGDKPAEPGPAVPVAPRTRREAPTWWTWMTCCTSTPMGR
jgi:hypothetical protein